MNWKLDEYKCWVVEGSSCTIFLCPRPAYCDRGQWIAYLETRGRFSLEIDGADAFPRYYFNLERAKAEIQDWLVCRKQVEVEGEPLRQSPGGEENEG